jgi:hypothetical protein
MGAALRCGAPPLRCGGASPAHWRAIPREPEQTEMAKLSSPQFDAIVAALRYLAREMERNHVSPNDGDIGNILTNDGEHAGLSIEQIDALCDALLHNEIRI